MAGALPVGRCATRPTDALVLDDRDLVTRAQAGDTEAIDDLLRAARSIVLRTARRRLGTYAGGAEVAEDVTQEACLALANALPRYRDTGAPFAVLVYAIASNKIADAQRHYARNPVHLVELLPDKRDAAPGPEQQLLAHLEADAARTQATALLAQLKPRAARLVQLRAEGRTTDEVAELLGMTVNAVRVAHHRALAQLRQLVEAAEPPAQDLDPEGDSRGSAHRRHPARPAR